MGRIKLPGGGSVKIPDRIRPLKPPSKRKPKNVIDPARKKKRAAQSRNLRAHPIALRRDLRTLPYPNCTFFYHSANVAYPNAILTLPIEGYLEGCFSQGQEASEGSEARVWTHVLLARLTALEGMDHLIEDNWTTNYTNETTTAWPIVGVVPSIVKAREAVPSAANDTQFWVVFVERNDKPIDHFRIYLRRRTTPD